MTPKKVRAIFERFAQANPAPTTELEYRTPYQLLVAVSIGMGLIPVVRPEFFAQLPLWMSPITHSGIAMATLSALSLNILFNILGGAERPEVAHTH